MLRQKILDMVQEKRKDLVINKFILWYLKKSLESGMKPKIYKKVLAKHDISFA